MDVSVMWSWFMVVIMFSGVVCFGWPVKLASDAKV